ncbi:MAG: hypothetical protein C0514_07875 [Candidatus Puniceispirillum sp.]|nr:hypothetical protein [Candidatus Puniceispirillum sp.]
MIYIFFTKDESFDFELAPLCEKGSRRVVVLPEVLYIQDKAQLDAFFTDVVLTENFDFESIEAIVDAQVSAHPFEELVLLTCDEDFMLSVARLREKYGVVGDGVEVVTRFTHKDQMKDYLRARAPAVDLPRFELFDAKTFKRVNGHYLAHIEDYLHFPVFVKPINQCATNNAAKLTSQEELRSWCTSHIRDKTIYEFDEFIDGELYHCDTVKVDGRIASVFVSRYNKPCFDFMAGNMRASILLPFDSHDYEILRAFNDEVLKGLDTPDNAVTHLEVFRTKEGRTIFLEIGLRPPGANIPKMYTKCLGVNIQEAHFLMQLHQKPETQVKQEYFGAMCDFPIMGGVVDAHNPLPALESQTELTWFIEPGQKVHASRNVVERSCMLMLLHKDQEAVERDITKLGAWQSCTYRPLA